MKKVLISDSLSDGWQEVFEGQGIEVDMKPGLAPEALSDIIGEYDGLIVRSDTQVTKDLINASTRLRVVGRAGVGVDNIDVDAATERGVIVLFAPGGNTISTAEHTVGMLLALSRNIPQAAASIRNGEWDRKRYTGVELSEKVLGIIGVGRVGQQVAYRARSFGMSLVGYDPILSDEIANKLQIKLCTLDEVFASSDYISLHTPLTDGTHHLVSAETLEKCKTGVRILNCARGGLIDEEALLAGIASGKVAGAALDVYEHEPPAKDDPLLKRPEVIGTPHLGASTREAQQKVARQIAQEVLDVLMDRPAQNAVNMPTVDPALFETIRPYLMLAEKVGALQAQLSGGNLKRIAIEYHGDILQYATSPMTAAVLKGAISSLSDEPISYVNAPLFAQKRGVTLDETRKSDHQDYANLMTVLYETSQAATSISATVFGKRDARVVRIDQFEVKAKLEGHMLFCCNRDVTGVVGWIGSLLADENINIADMALGRESLGGRAIMVLSVDSPLDEDVLKRISDAPQVFWAKQAKL